MKKFIAMLLALAICCGFAGCNVPGIEYKTEIVGEWMAVSVNAAATFNSDGTGEIILNGKHIALWSYQPKTDRYVVEADKTYTVLAGKEYDMDYISIDGIDFYRFDDYDKAYTLLISRRFEDIAEHTAGMNRIEAGNTYDLDNGVTIQFNAITASEMENDDGLIIDFTILNNRTTAASNGFTLALNGRYFLFDHNDAVEKTDYAVLTGFVDAEAAYTGSFRISLDEKVSRTLSRYGRLIGAVTFEMYGSKYYIDLTDYFLKAEQK